MLVQFGFAFQRQLYPWGWALLPFSKAAALFQYADDFCPSTVTQDVHLRLLNKFLMLLPHAGLKCNPTKVCLLPNSFLSRDDSVWRWTDTISEESRFVFPFAIAYQCVHTAVIFGPYWISHWFHPWLCPYNCSPNHLLKKAAPWHWTEQHTQAVTTLSQAVPSPPTLATPDPLTVLSPGGHCQWSHSVSGFSSGGVSRGALTEPSSIPGSSSGSLWSATKIRTPIPCCFPISLFLPSWLPPRLFVFARLPTLRLPNLQPPSTQLPGFIQAPPVPTQLNLI